jgi:branched-chain amino acid transport system ATP-binding protein
VPLLSVENVSRRFGGIVALDDVSFSIDEGEIVGLIGPNGAGKTTAFNVITRLYAPETGRILFDGADLLGVPASRVVRLGIARTFQNLALFSAMTVLENVLVGAHTRLGARAGRSGRAGPQPDAPDDGTVTRPRGERALRAEALELLAYLGLDAYAASPAAGLPFGTLKRLELARALIARPRLLLLDEPAGGLNHEEVAELSERVRRFQADFALTILLVEHHMNLVMSISDRVTVLNFGRVIASGTPAEVRASPQVIEAYLGTEEDAVAIAEVASGEDA